jgi:hypothetical protein
MNNYRPPRFPGLALFIENAELIVIDILARFIELRRRNNERRTRSNNEQPRKDNDEL